MHACGQEILTHACKRRRFGSAEHVRCNREIELINQATFQQGAKERWAAFACESADLVFTAQYFQHGGQIDLVGFSKIQGGFVFERGLSFLWHSPRGKNEDRRSGGSENVQSTVDPAFVRDDYTQWGWDLLSFDSGLLQIDWDSQPNIVTLQTGVPK